MSSVSMWPDTGTLSTIASVIAAFAITMLFFRVQRELEMSKNDEIVWIPWADWLLLSACFIALLLVLLPLVAAHPTSWAFLRLPPAACSAAIVLVAGYPVALFAHYRIWFKKGDRYTRYNPEPSEKIVVLLTAALAVAASAWAFHLHS